MSSKPDDLEAVRSIAAALEPFEAGDRERILRWVKERLGMPSGPPPAAVQAIASSLQPAGTVSPIPIGEQPPRDIRTFVAEKAPKTDLQLIPVIGYYFRFIASGDEHKDAISTQDVKDACRKAGRAIPKRTGQTLVNACAAGYMDRAGRGQYAINTVGENLVATVLGPGGAGQEVRPRRTARVAKSGSRNSKR